MEDVYTSTLKMSWGLFGIIMCEPKEEL